MLCTLIVESQGTYKNYDVMHPAVLHHDLDSLVPHDDERIDAANDIASLLCMLRA
jgi:hypothetical protein